LTYALNYQIQQSIMNLTSFEGESEFGSERSIIRRENEGGKVSLSFSLYSHIVQVW